MLPQTSATFSVGNPNHSIEKIYGKSDNITGWVNMSFSSEPLSSVFSDSSSANLSDVLKRNIVSYSCSPIDCKNDYSGSNPSQTKATTLNSGESKIYGIKLTGSISSINSLKFTIDSTAGNSCTNQIEIDFLDDSVIDSINQNSTESASCIGPGFKSYGCFDSGSSFEELNIGTTPLCERVNLSVSPGFFIGAWIKKVSGSMTVNASIYETNGGAPLARCSLPDASTSGEEVSCSTSYSVIKQGEYYVCIHSASGSGVYRTKGYSPTNGCGFSGTPPVSETPGAYQIFAQGKEFGAVGSIEINKSISDGRSFADLAEEYLIEKYGSMNCGSSGCIIPIRIKSNSNQDLTLRNLEVQYQKDIGSISESNIYDVQPTAAKITSGFQKLYLDGSGFSVPSSLGNYTFSLKFNSQNIFSEKIEVKDIPIINSVTPIKTAAAYPTEFVASVSSQYNLTGFSWDFGDNTLEITTQGNKTSHTYNSTGVYNLRVRVTDQRQLSASRVFVINVTSPRDLINSNLIDLENDLSNIKREVSSLTGFDKDAVNFSLNLGYLDQRIISLKAAYQNATESQYNAIVAGILGLRIPEGISKSRSAEDLTLFSGPDYVDLGILKEIGGGTYDASNEEGYINGVLLWQRENLNVDLDFNEFSGRYPGYTEPIARIFEISIDEKRDISYDYYLVLPELDGFKTDAQYDIKSGYIYINLKGKRSVSFSTTENVDFTNLPAFISPAISRLTVTETLPEEPRTNKWVIFVLVLFFLFVIGLVGYVIMQQWYKRKYEHHLFPNRNDLYNMVNYIHNARRKGLKNSEIEENLKKAGWSSEKIRYVMKKYAGKRTGMLEIPITKLAEKAGGKPKNQK